MKKRVIICICLLAILACLLGFWYWCQPFNHSIGPYATISWQRGGVPYQAICTVTDPEGVPIPGVQIHVDNSSGGNSRFTDANGVAVLDLGEPEITRIQINNIVVFTPPLDGWLGIPSVQKGLTIKCTITDRQILDELHKKANP